MANFKYLLVIVFTISGLNCQSTLAQTTINIGEGHVINSEYLGNNRSIQVSTPENYDATKKYPVLYLLDGQRFFLYGASLQQSFRQFKLTPDFIVVGVDNQYPQRFDHFSESEKFMKFISKEVTPYIDRHYNTNGENLFFGWEYGGAFLLDLATTNNRFFQAFFLASPFPITEKRLNKIDSVYKVEGSNPLLYLTVSEHENQVNEGIDRLLAILKNSRHTNWLFELLPNESHRSTPYHTIYYGLCEYFHNYPELQFTTLSEYRKKGGLSYVYEYYQQRATRFGFPDKPTAWTRFSLIRNAVRANDLNEFLLLVKEFNNEGFITSLNESRLKTIADYYLTNGYKPEAKNLAKSYLKAHPESSLIRNFLLEIEQG